MAARNPQTEPARRTEPVAAVSVSTVLPTPRRAGLVVLAVDGQTIELSSSEAFDLQRRILSATIAVQRAGAQIEATRKAKVQRELQRASDTDEELRERDV